MGFAPVQLDEDLIAGIQVQNDAVARVVIVLICVLCNGTGPDLEWEMKELDWEGSIVVFKKSTDRRKVKQLATAMGVKVTVG